MSSPHYLSAKSAQRFQQKLYDLNFFDGDPNVINAEKQHMAVEKLQEYLGIKKTGIGDRATLHGMDAEIAKRAGYTAPDMGDATPAKLAIADWQKKLSILGLYKGPINGDFAAVRPAIEAFEAQRNLDGKGRPTQEAKNLLDDEVHSKLLQREQRTVDVATGELTALSNQQQETKDKSAAREEAINRKYDFHVDMASGNEDRSNQIKDEKILSRLPFDEKSPNAYPNNIIEFQRAYNVGKYGHKPTPGLELPVTGFPTDSTVNAMKGIMQERESVAMAAVEKVSAQELKTAQDSHTPKVAGVIDQLSPEGRRALAKISQELGVRPNELGMMIASNGTLVKAAPTPPKDQTQEAALPLRH